MKKTIVKINKRIMVIVFLITALFVVGCGSSGSSDTGSESVDKKTKDSITFAVVTGNPSHWLAVFAEENGFFDKYNLDVDIQGFASGVATVESVVMDTADIGYMSDYAILNKLGVTQSSTDLRIFANFGTENQNLYVNPDKVDKIEDLADQGFLTIAGSVRDFYTAKTLEKAGIPKEHQNIIAVEDQQAALGAFENGDGVAFWTGGTGGAKLESAGMKKLMNIEDLGLTNLSFFIAKQSFLENDDVTERFLKAIKETQTWLLENVEEAAEIAYDKMQIPQDVFISEQEMVSWTISLEKEAFDYLEGLKSWLVENYDLADFNLSDFINTDALEEVFPESVTYKK